MALSTFDKFFASDEEKSKNGVPIPFGFNADNEPITVWVAENGNPNHERCQRRYSRQLEQSRKNRALYNEVIAKIVAESILIKWEGFLDTDKKQIPPTTENKFGMLKKYERFMNAILAESANHDNFAIGDSEAEEDSLGN